MPESFDQVNDADISEINSYYYQKYKLKKRRKSSLNKELRKIEDEKLERTGSVKIGTSTPHSQVSNSKKYGTAIHEKTIKELEDKREAILHQFTKLDSRDGPMVDH